MLPRGNYSGKIENANQGYQIGNEGCTVRHAGCDLEEMRQTPRGREERE